MRSVGHNPPGTLVRVGVAMVLGVAGGSLAYWHLAVVEPNMLGFDFTWAWRGARALLAGENPYVVIQPTGPFPFNSAFKYPLPVAVIALPVAHLSAQAAAGVFGGAGFALLSFALMRDGYWRLPILSSAPCLLTLAMGQWSLLLTAAALMPAASWLVCLKPTTGLASFAYNPRVSAVVGSIAAFAVCLLIIPTWPIQWMRAMFFDPSTHWYVSAVQLPFGFLLLLSTLRWRTREGRMLLALSIVPQVQAIYSGLIALLAARNFREASVLTIVSSLGYLGYLWFDWDVPSDQLLDPAHQAPWLMMTSYLPALLVVLLRPNEGAVPPWLERRLARVPRWLRGRSQGF
jgi:hypothetical protein